MILAAVVLAGLGAAAWFVWWHYCFPSPDDDE